MHRPYWGWGRRACYNSATGIDELRGLRQQVESSLPSIPAPARPLGSPPRIYPHPTFPRPRLRAKNSANSTAMCSEVCQLDGDLEHFRQAGQFRGDFNRSWSDLGELGRLRGARVQLRPNIGPQGDPGATPTSSAQIAPYQAARHCDFNAGRCSDPQGCSDRPQRHVPAASWEAATPLNLAQVDRLGR